MSNQVANPRSNRIFWGFTFLVTFALWMYSFEVNYHDIGEVLLSGVIGVVLSAFTFWFVGIGLAILLIPVKILFNLVRDVLGLRKDNAAAPPPQDDNKPSA